MSEFVKAEGISENRVRYTDSDKFLKVIKICFRYITRCLEKNKKH